MNKTILISIIVIVVIVAAAYFFYANQNSLYKPADTNQTANPQPTTGDLSASVSIKNFAFNPTPLTVKVGTTITWINSDSMAHQIKSATFNSVALSNGQNFQFTFSTVGEYDYSCAIHPSMLGKIIVVQ